MITACGSAQKETAAAVPAATPAEVTAELSAPETYDGSILLVTVKLPPEYQKSSVIMGDFEGTELPFFAASDRGEGIFEAVLAVPYGRKPGPGEVTIRLEAEPGKEQKILKLPISITEGNYASEELRVSPRHVNPNLKDLKRIRKEQAEVKGIYARITRTKYWSGPFVLPIESPITSPFGIKRVYNGELQNFHPGLDLKAPVKTPIRAPAPGVVVLAKNLFYTGKTVMIDHGYGVITLYAHMSKLRVKKGQVIKKGQLLGLSGMTGRVTGPHLHWQAVIHKVKVNPLELTKVLR